MYFDFILCGNQNSIDLKNYLQKKILYFFRFWNVDATALISLSSAAFLGCY